MQRAASEKKGGRKQAIMAQPGLQEAIEEAVATQTAGSPVDERIRWTNRSPAEIVSEVVAQGFSVCADTVRNILIRSIGAAAPTSGERRGGLQLSPSATRSFGTSPSCAIGMSVAIGR